jgi:hypothetical protein
MRTHTNNTNKYREKEYGQALLFVVVAVTIALSVGVSIATRTLSSQKRVVSSDTATRVANASEGGAEAALGKPYSTLASLTSPSLDNAACQGYGFSYAENNKCVITYPSAPGDSIVTKATISVTPFTMNGLDNYWFNLSPGMVKEIRLAGYTGTDPYVCWENSKAAIYTLSYNSSGGIKKSWFVSTSFDNSTGKTSGFATVDNSAHSEHPEYTGCKQISLVSSPYGLRIKTLYSSTRVHVYPGSGFFPSQGYKITSIGELVSGGSQESKIVVVYKSFPYAASIIDAGLYSATGGID